MDKICTELENLLNEEQTLYLKTRKFHWNITGTHFYSLHKQLEIQYQDLDVIADELAERIRKLDSFVKTTNEALLKTHIKDDAKTETNDQEILKTLLKDHTYLIEKYHHAIKQTGIDPGTQDLLTQQIQKHEKIKWQLKTQITN